MYTTYGCNNHDVVLLNLTTDGTATATSLADSEGKLYPVLANGADGGYAYYNDGSAPSSCFIAPDRTILNGSLYPTLSEMTDAFNATGNIEENTCEAVLNADFDADVTDIPEGGQVNFTDNSTDAGSAITSWNWTFSGGTPSSYSGQNPPTITYSTVGHYDVVLTVTNPSGTDDKTRTGYITVIQLGDVFTLDFEASEDYSQIFWPWLNVDNDGSTTYGSSDCDFPGEGGAFSFMAFNPTDAGFSLASAHGGDRCGMAVCPNSTTVSSDNWIISDEISVSSSSEFVFWVLTPKPGSWGNELFNVLVSTTNTNTSSFSAIASNVEAPTSWTQKTYSLSSYAGQGIYVAIQHVSLDKFMFLIDDIEITNAITTGSKIVEDNIISIYPNPSYGNITINNVLNSTIEISDINGKTVISDFANSDNLNIDLSSFDKGTYFVKIINNKSVSVKKIILR